MAQEKISQQWKPVSFTDIDLKNRRIVSISLELPLDGDDEEVDVGVGERGGVGSLGIIMEAASSFISLFTGTCLVKTWSGGDKKAT